jgi:hypothetical protein
LFHGGVVEVQGNITTEKLTSEIISEYFTRHLPDIYKTPFFFVISLLAQRNDEERTPDRRSTVLTRATPSGTKNTG